MSKVMLEVLQVVCTPLMLYVTCTNNCISVNTGNSSFEKRFIPLNTEWSSRHHGNIHVYGFIHEFQNTVIKCQRLPRSHQLTNC